MTRSVPLICDCECYCTEHVARPKPGTVGDMASLLMCPSCLAGYHVMAPQARRRWVAGDQRNVRYLLDTPMADRSPSRPSPTQADDGRAPDLSTGWRRFLRWLVHG